MSTCFSFFHFVSPLGEAVIFALHGLTCAGCRSPGASALRPGAPGSDSPPFRPRGSAYILRSFPSIPIYLPYCIFRNFLFILHLLLFALCREVQARGRGGAHSHAAGCACWLFQWGLMRCTLYKTWHGLLARSESVLALAPPPAAPSAVLASLWRGRWSGGAPFLFPFFFLPVFSSLPEVTLCSKEFAWREG